MPSVDGWRPDVCGIAGFFDFTHGGSVEILDAMADVLEHRGPDDRGVLLHTVATAQVGLGHRRLSIIDLRPEASQPMRKGNQAIVFNGEIYNYVEVRNDLLALGYEFTSTSDTEVLLHAFAEWGPACVHRLIGMFAFVIVDVANGVAYLVRDRAGVKPLYVHHDSRRLLFASESKALRQHPAFQPELNVEAFSRYFDYGVVPGSMSIYDGVEQVPPGSWLELDLETGQAEVHRYWSLDTFYASDRLDLDYDEALERFSELFQSSARYRMVADVPVGLFLSGGYDSTAVLASLVQDAEAPIKAFTIGFEVGNNELPQATQIARHLGAEHHGYVCTEHDARSIISELPDIYDEPFADSSAIPTTLVSRFAARHVKVALSADGGDELMFGYTSYAKLGRRMARLSRLPKRSRRWIGEALHAVTSLVPATAVRRRHMLEGLAASLHHDDAHMGLSLHVLARQLPRSYAKALFRGFVQAETESTLFTNHALGPIDQAAAWDYAN